MTIRLLIPERFKSYYYTGGLPDDVANSILDECGVYNSTRTIKEFVRAINGEEILIDYMHSYLTTRGIDIIFEAFTSREIQMAALFNVMRLYRHDSNTLKMVFYCFSGGINIFEIDGMDISYYAERVLKNKYGIDVCALEACSNHNPSSVVMNFPGNPFINRIYICILMQLELYEYNKPINRNIDVTQYIILGILSCMSNIDAPVKDNPVIDFMSNMDFANEFISTFCAYLFIKIYRHGTVYSINPFVVKFIIATAKTIMLDPSYMTRGLNSVDLNTIYEDLSDNDRVQSLLKNPMPFIPRFLNSLKYDFFKGTDVLLYSINNCNSIEEISNKLIIEGKGDLAVIHDAIRYLVNVTRYFRELLPNQFKKLDSYIYSFSALYKDPDACRKIYIQHLAGKGSKSYKELKEAISYISDQSLRDSLEEKYKLDSLQMIITAKITI